MRYFKILAILSVFQISLSTFAIDANSETTSPIVQNDLTDPFLEILNIGLTKSKSLESQSLKLEQSSNLKTNSYFDLLPTLSLSAGKTLTDAEDLSSGEVGKTHSESYSMRVTGSWTIWDNYQNIRNITLQGLEYSAEKIRTTKELESYSISLLDQFFEYHLSIKRQQVLHNQLDQAKWTYSESKALFEAGAKTRLEMIDSEIQMMNTERDIQENENAIQQSIRSLKLLINEDDLDKINSIRKTINWSSYKPFFEQKFNSLFSKINFDEISIESNLEYRIASLSLKKNQEELAQTRMNYWPKLSLRASHEWDMDRRIDPNPYLGLRNDLQTTTISLNLSWTFWDWWNTPRSITNSNYEFQISANRYHDDILKTKTEIKNLLEQYNSLVKSITVSEKSLEKSRYQMDYSKELYKLGKLNLLQLQQSTSRTFDAEMALANRLKLKYITMAKIMYIYGISILPNH